MKAAQGAERVSLFRPCRLRASYGMDSPIIAPQTVHEIQAEFGVGLRSETDTCVTAPWGNAVGSFDNGEWTRPDGVVDFNDIAAAVDKFTHAPTAPPWRWYDVAPETPDGVLDFVDISYIVEAFQSIPYVIAGPDPCLP